MAEVAAYQDPAVVQRVLRRTKAVAIAGLSANPLRASHFVGFYAMRHGYRVIPANPREEAVPGPPVGALGGRYSWGLPPSSSNQVLVLPSPTYAQQLKPKT